MLALTAGSVASWAASLALTATNGKSKQFGKKVILSYLGSARRISAYSNKKSRANFVMKVQTLFRSFKHFTRNLPDYRGVT